MEDKIELFILHLKMEAMETYKKKGPLSINPFFQ
jgi:hypothetical protein